MIGKSTHLQVIPQKSTQNAAKLPLQNMRQKPVEFLLNDTGVDFNFRNNFASLCFFAKVSVPLQFIIPCLGQGITEYTGTKLLRKNPNRRSFCERKRTVPVGNG